MSVAVFQSIGVTELLIVLGILLLIFGPKRLPALGRQLGAGMAEFRDSIRKRGEDDDEDDDAVAAAPELPQAAEAPLEGEVVRDRQ